MLLRPQRNFTVVRQLANHLDTSTYYVRAVIRDAFTDEILATLDLDDKGSQRFSKNWQVVADPSGLGREISIVTSVYTDSGYTTKSENYGDEENSHLIEDARIGGMGGGGVDYYVIRKIIQEELGELPKPDPVVIPEMPKMKWDEVLTAITNIKEALPSSEKLARLDRIIELITTARKEGKDQHNAIVQALTEISTKLDSTAPTEVDLSPVLQAIEKTNTPLPDHGPEYLAILKDIRDALVRRPESIDISKISL